MLFVTIECSILVPLFIAFILIFCPLIVIDFEHFIVEYPMGSLPSTGHVMSFQYILVHLNCTFFRFLGNVANIYIYIYILIQHRTYQIHSHLPMTNDQCWLPIGC